MSSIKVRLRVSKFFPHDGSRAPIQVEFEGLPEEKFLETASRAVKEGAGWQHDEVLWFLDYRFEDYPEVFSLRLDDQITFGQVREVFGDELSADPATIDGAWGGRGGDSWYFIPVVETLAKAIAVGRFVTASLSAWKIAMRIRYREGRSLAKDWNDSGVVSMELTRAVLAQSVWTRGTFDTTFGLSESRGPELLRLNGYERHRRDDVEVWVEKEWGRENGFYD